MKRLIIITIIVFLIVTIGFVYYTFKPQIYNWLKANKLVPLPETFTELYFEDHLKLPKTVDKNPSKEYSFKFTIHNLEYKNMKYKYEIKAITDTTEDIFATDEAELKQNEFKTIPFTFVLKQPEPKRVKIEVNLVNKNQPIHFWMESP